jgi:hypothetical protein
MERDWKEEQRDVLARLFDAVFERRETSEEETGSDIHWLGTTRRLSTLRRLRKRNGPSAGRAEAAISSDAYGG